MKIYETIHFLRQYRGFSQEYMAEKLNIDTVTYGRVENGKIKLTIERLDDIADVLGFSSQRIYEISNNKLNHKTKDEILNLLIHNIHLSEKILEQINKIK